MVLTVFVEVQTQIQKEDFAFERDVSPLIICTTKRHRKTTHQTLAMVHIYILVLTVFVEVQTQIEKEVFAFQIEREGTAVSSNCMHRKEFQD